MSNKKGIELSVNFIVMLILAIVLFGFGLYFAGSLFEKSESITEKTFEDFDRQTEDLACSTAEKVCIPTTTKSVGGEGYVIVSIIVENVLGEKREFQLQAEPSVYVNKQGKEQIFDKRKLLISPDKTNTRRILLDNRERKRMGIAVEPKGMPSGTYAFNLYVEYKDKASGNFVSYTDDRPMKFYVVVP